jgi:hypothetical protein
MPADVSPFRYRLSQRDPVADAVWVFGFHARGVTGVCRGCLKLYRRPVAWPCERFALAALFIGCAGGVEVR